MKYLVLLLIIAINFILQSTILPYFSFFNVVPNTGLVLVVIIAVLLGKRVGPIAGLIVGFLQDILFSSVIGVNSFIYFFIAYIIGLVEDKLYKDSYILPVLMTSLSTLAYHLIYFAFMYFLNYQFSFINFLKEIVFIETIYNSLISLILYKPLIRLFSSPSIRFIRK